MAADPMKYMPRSHMVQMLELNEKFLINMQKDCEESGAAWWLGGVDLLEYHPDERPGIEQEWKEKAREFFLPFELEIGFLYQLLEENPGPGGLIPYPNPLYYSADEVDERALRDLTRNIVQQRSV